MIEEHKLKRPLQQEKDDIISIITSITKELNYIVVQQQQQAHVHLDEQRLECAKKDVQQHIKDKDFEWELPSSTSTSPSHSPSPEDDDLATARLETTSNFLVTLNVDGLKERVGLLVHQCSEVYNLKDKEQHPSSRLDYQILSMDTEGRAHLFDPTACTWTQLQDQLLDVEQRLYTYQSVVAVNNSLFVFGGLDDSKSYAHHSLSKNRQLHRYGYISTKEGGRDIAACYDGAQYIYIVGGSYCGEKLTRVDRMDLVTQELHAVNLLDRTVHALKHDTGEFEDVSGRFQLASFARAIYSICYDDQDNLYIINYNLGLTRISLTTGEATRLSSLAIWPGNQPRGHLSYYVTLVYIASANGDQQHLYFIGGKSIGNHRYSINDDQWTRMNDGDTFERISSGATRILRPRSN
ncbi:hypothetical protein SAMD00019534_096920 [Acytostelium subglobosum LB1]|uniref:hypothetical protein n=1 Tax=Acytostelium subglobosum LB1 TaxID=1410327 RepID=UPI0006449216|nr:hypothetical protein SAMD00019534_096920 [Acytostelium subglobosum LB1]GAM26517.1 hypothetical protein SAMD00019534_096920 [Acytostelium subglobosum LB1]|eukprot:XP_012750613.1 hypothetical protein SAMD00019534_096920 [Acytostelium subglobosum LB1]